MKKLVRLEAIRGFAAVYVVFHHLFSKGLVIGGIDVSIFFRFGQEAVILFFVLSGIVINYSFSLSKDKSFLRFFTKRFLRIYIPLVAVFITNYFLYWYQDASKPPINWNVLACNLLMLQDASFLKPNVICDPFLGNTPLWSLSYEWWFYMIFFFVVKKFHQKASMLVYITGTLATLSYLFLPNFVNRELMYLIIWWVGADIATLYIQKQEISFKTLKIPFLFLLVNCLLLVVNVAIHPRTTIGISPFLELRHFGFALVAVGIAVTWKKFKWVGFNLTIGQFERFASISFVIYISHWFLVARASYLDNLVPNYFLRTVLYIIGCFLFSYLVERIIYPALNKSVSAKVFAMAARRKENRKAEATV